MTMSRTTAAVSRRTALTGLGAGAFGLVLAAQGTSAQEATPSPLTGHLQVGVWMIESGIGRAIAVYTADGAVVTALTPTQAGPGGLTYASTQIGVWEPTGPRTTHLTVASSPTTPRIAQNCITS